MRILLTGAFGFLAGRLAEAWTTQGHQVILSDVAVPDDAAAWAKAYEIRLADVLQEAALGALVAGVDAVVNLAALNEHQAAASPDRALQVSGEGNRLLLEAARAAGSRRFVFFSTFHVYGPRAPMHITEETPVRAAHPYSIAHLAGEGYCHQANVRAGQTWAVSLRLSNGYGCPVRKHVDRWTLAHNDFCRQAVERGHIVLKTAGTQERDFVWVEDVAAAISRVLSAPADSLGDGVFNLSGGKTLTVLDLANLVAARAEKAFGARVAIERPDALGPVAPSGLKFDCSRLSRLGYMPRDGLVEETDRLLTMLSR